MALLELIIAIVAAGLVLWGGLFIAASVLSSEHEGNLIQASNSERRKGLMKGITLVIIGILVLMLTSLIAIVPAGSVGVKNTFGVVDSDVFQSGLYVKSPFTDVIPMSTQSKKYMDYGNSDTATITALSNEGLSVSMGIAVNYRLNPLKAAEVYKPVGEGYEGIVMTNPIHAVPRDIISRYDAKTLYSAASGQTADRAKIEIELYDGISKGINNIGVRDSVILEQVSIRNIDLPQTLKDSITNKLKMEQEITQKELEVRKQEMEANRMRAEAQGIADANKIISGSLTQNYLDWYAIEMMKTHTGATYFIPIGADGRFHPETVIPIATQPASSS